MQTVVVVFVPFLIKSELLSSGTVCPGTDLACAATLPLPGHKSDALRVVTFLGRFISLTL